MVYSRILQVIIPMINKSRPCEGLNIGIPFVIPIEGRGFINQGSGLVLICSTFLLGNLK